MASSTTGTFPRAAVLAVTVMSLACGGPSAPSEPRLMVRLTVSPPTLQAVRRADGWTAFWTVNVDAANEFPPDSHGVIASFGSAPVFVETIQASVATADGRLIAQVADDEAAIRATNGGANPLSAGGLLLQVAQAVSYDTPAQPPSTSGLTLVVQFRDGRGSRRQLVTQSTIHEQMCGYRGGPPC